MFKEGMLRPTNLSQVTDRKDTLLLLPCLDEQNLMLGKQTNPLKPHNKPQTLERLVAKCSCKNLFKRLVLFINGFSVRYEIIHYIWHAIVRTSALSQDSSPMRNKAFK